MCMFRYRTIKCATVRKNQTKRYSTKTGRKGTTKSAKNYTKHLKKIKHNLRKNKSRKIVTAQCGQI